MYVSLPPDSLALVVMMEQLLTIGLFGSWQNCHRPDFVDNVGAATGVAVGDFNGDGRPDAAVTESSWNTVSVFLSDGSGAPLPPSLRITDVAVTEGNTGNGTATAGSDYANPNDCGASISSRDLILTPETSRPTQSLFGLGPGRDSGTSPRPLPGVRR